MKYYIKVKDGNRYETVYNSLRKALQSLVEYEKEGWSGLVIENEEYEEYEANEARTEVYFDMLKEGKTSKEIRKATGILKIEKERGQRVVTLYYPEGDIVSHWL